MAKICSSCHYTASDSEVFCPACGTYLPAYDPAQGAQPYPQADQSQPQGVPYSGAQPPIATPLHMQQNNPGYPNNDSSFVQTRKPGERSGRLPFIIIGVAAAALVFVLVLIIVMNSRDASKPTSGTTTVSATTTTADSLVGRYKWMNGGEGQSGSLVISSDNTGVFTLDGSGTVDITFDPSQKKVSYPGADGTILTGTYTLSNGTLRMTVDGYTDVFEKE